MYDQVNRNSQTGPLGCGALCWQITVQLIVTHCIYWLIKPPFFMMECCLLVQIELPKLGAEVPVLS